MLHLVEIIVADTSCSKPSQEKTFSFARFPINGFVKHGFTIGHNGQLSTSGAYGRFPAFDSMARRGENIEVIVVDSFIEALRDKLGRHPDIGFIY